MSEQKMRLRMIKDHCQTAAKVLTVLMVFTVIGIVICLGATAFCLVKPTEINEVLEQEVEAGNLTIYNINDKNGINLFVDYSPAIEAGNYVVPVVGNLIFGAVMCVAALVILSMLKGTMVELFNVENPFAPHIMSRLKTAFIVVTVVAFVMEGVAVALVSGALLWCIYAVLEYGQALQNEVDETL